METKSGLVCLVLLFEFPVLSSFCYLLCVSELFIVPKAARTCETKLK